MYRFYPLFIILVLGFIVYSNSLFNNFVWEDWEQVAQNPFIQNFSNLPHFFQGGTYFEPGKDSLEGNLYRPLLVIYFSALISIFKTNPFVFHFIQVLIHCINAFLLFIFLKKFIEQKNAFWLSLIFLVHPINTEAVSYISIVNDPLYFLFGMIGLILLQKNILVMGISFLLSLFSKESGILFLYVSVLYSFLFQKHLFIKVLIANILVVAAYLFIRLSIAHSGFGNVGSFPMERLALESRLLNIPSILLFYLTTFIFPLHLSVGRQWSVTQVNFNEFFLPIFVLLVTIFGSFITAKKVIKIDKHWKIFLFFSLWLIIGLLPYLQIFPLNMTVGERWFYFVQVGLLGMIGILASQLFKYKYAVYILIVIILLFAVRTFWRNFDWKNDATLFQHDVLINPNSYMIQTGLGVVYFQEGKYQEAEQHLLDSLKLFPYQSTAWVNLGSLYEKRKEFNKALYYFEGSLDKHPTSFTYERISTLKIILGDFKEAEEITKLGLKTYPKSAKLHGNLGLVYYKKNNIEMAIPEIEKGYKLSGDNLYLDILKKIQAGQNFTINY